MEGRGWIGLVTKKKIFLSQETVWVKGGQVGTTKRYLFSLWSDKLGSTCLAMSIWYCLGLGVTQTTRHFYCWFVGLDSDACRLNITILIYTAWPGRVRFYFFIPFYFYLTFRVFSGGFLYPLMILNIDSFCRRYILKHLINFLNVWL